ncbi:DUF3515 family protein [Nocardia cyriacigeorgica]|uniref:DUF3515 family protein n=1 Tax=Nocardia cyriacigeorgica TaxID=135487 RepID=UPI0024576392|nr:DUF3515 family protein [Nocardia cyriacigeorgica]
MLGPVPAPAADSEACATLLPALPADLGEFTKSTLVEPAPPPLRARVAPLPAASRALAPAVVVPAPPVALPPPPPPPPPPPLCVARHTATAVIRRHSLWGSSALPSCDLSHGLHSVIRTIYHGSPPSTPRLPGNLLLIPLNQRTRSPARGMVAFAGQGVFTCS